jgi:endonuclease/exonuclease/phosphatase (EEP) superfamily protein YafD
MSKAHADLTHLGFQSFPTESMPPTYRSASVTSTIDFVFHRNLNVGEKEVARIFIAQHRPVATQVSLTADSSPPGPALETAYG